MAPSGSMFVVPGLRDDRTRQRRPHGSRMRSFCHVVPLPGTSPRAPAAKLVLATLWFGVDEAKLIIGIGGINEDYSKLLEQSSGWFFAVEPSLVCQPLITERMTLPEIVYACTVRRTPR